MGTTVDLDAELVRGKMQVRWEALAADYTDYADWELIVGRQSA